METEHDRLLWASAISLVLGAGLALAAAFIRYGRRRLHPRNSLRLINPKAHIEDGVGKRCDSLWIVCPQAGLALCPIVVDRPESGNGLTK
jgi:hypothetical protein